MKKFCRNRCKAFAKKWRVSNSKERIKLAGKLGLRLIGVKKCMFLGGYREEEDLLQRQQDQEIYERLSTVPQKSLPERKGKKPLREKYLALMVETLDVGGLEEVVKLLAEEYTARGIPVKIFCAKEGGRIAEELRDKGIETMTFHGDDKRFKEYLIQNPPVLINTHYVQSFVKEIAELGIPVVEVIHNMYVFLTEKQLCEERRKAEYISEYIAVSQKAKEVYRAKVPTAFAKKITVIGNCGKALDDTKHNNRNEMREKLNIPAGAFVLACIGSVDARKNQLGIVRAWDVVSRLGIPEAYLLLVGKSTDTVYEKKVQEVIKYRNMENTVKVIGQCNEISCLLDAIDAVIIGSYYEGWSMAATEALYKGLPIIHADCGSGEELVAGGRNGYLTGMVLKNMLEMTSIQLNDAMQAGINENIEETATAILELIENRDCWAERKTEIRQYARQNFSTDKMIERYLEVYRSVAAQSFEKK